MSDEKELKSEIYPEFKREEHIINPRAFVAIGDGIFVRFQTLIDCYKEHQLKKDFTVPE